MKNFLTFLLLIFALSGYAQHASPSLTAVYEDNRQLVKLKWNHTNISITTYILQRSSDNYSWVDLFKMPITLPEENTFKTYKDQKPLPGKNFYRIKAILNNGNSSCSQSITVIIGKPGNNWIMYPVPVRDILNVEYNGNNLISGVIGITIQNMVTRQIFHKLRMASTNRLIQIPVSNLGKGLYLINISIANELVWHQQFTK